MVYCKTNQNFSTSTNSLFSRYLTHLLTKDDGPLTTVKLVRNLISCNTRHVGIISIETLSIRFFMENCKLQFVVMRLQFHVAAISNFSKVLIV